VWTFVESCARGQFPVAECSPVFQLVAIVILLAMAVAVLTWLVLQPPPLEPLEVSSRPHRHPAMPRRHVRAGNRLVSQVGVRKPAAGYPRVVVKEARDIAKKAIG
jgi:hypothetical protein